MSSISPLAAAAKRLVDALEFVGAPLAKDEQALAEALQAEDPARG